MKTSLLLRTIALFLIITCLVGCSAPVKNTPVPTLQDQNQSPVSTQTGKNLIIDTDMGVDDVMAILYLLQVENLNIQAITVSGTGLAHCTPGVRTVLGLLAVSGDQEIPVACGKDKPLKGDIAFPEGWRNGADQLAEMLELPAGGKPSNLNAIQLMQQVIEATPEKVSVLTLGPFTNLADLLQESPDLVGKIEQVVSMAGALEISGNVEEQPSAEWNVYVDPTAASRVFQSGLPITLVPLDATNAVPASKRSFLAFEQNQNTPEAKTIYQLLQRSSYSQAGNYYWDPLAATLLTEPGLGTYQILKLVVEESGDEIGQIRESEQGSSIRVAMTADEERFLQQIVSTLNGVPQVQLPSVESMSLKNDPSAQVVLKMVEKLNQGDVEGSLEYFSEDAIAYIVGLPPTGMEIYRGKEKIRELWLDSASNHFLWEVKVNSAEDGYVITDAKTWHDFTRQLGVAPLDYLDIYEIKDGKILSYNTTLIPSAQERFKPAFTAAIPPEPTPTPSSAPATSEMTVTFAEHTCTTDQPPSLKAGEVKVNFKIQDQDKTLYALIIFTLNEGKDLLDLMSATIGSPPSWMNMLLYKELGPGKSETYNMTVKEGPIYLICFFQPPSIVVGNAGPIPVKP